MTRQDFEKFLIKNPTEEKLKKFQNSQNETATPKPSRMISIAPPPKIGNDKIISFSATDEIPLKDVLIELGRAAKIDVDLDPNISGGVVISAYNRPLSEIIDRIAALGNLRYSYINGILHFGPDYPYSKSYFVDFLIDGTLWSDVENNITAILGRSSGGSNAASASSSQSSFSSNRSAGMISIFANDREHKEIAKFLDEIYKNSSAQVIIEAKIVEVDLNKDFEAGIDWTFITKHGGSITATNNNSAIGISTPPPISIKIPGANIAPTINALEKFGVARTISSPRINAMNNQKASLDFTKNLIYFTLASSASTSPATSTTTSTTSTVTATKTEIPLGVQIAITPSINLKTNEITLDIKPKLTTDTGKKIDDPTPITMTDENGKQIIVAPNKIPVIATRQLGTIAKVKSGDVLVIGGLMEQNTANTDTGTPFISKIPLFGNLFKSVSKTTTVTETVIFIKATIINNSNAVPKYDRELHDNFTSDNREYFK
jgi:type II secretory pathway component GspD/PulD (secretin)